MSAAVSFPRLHISLAWPNMAQRIAASRHGPVLTSFLPPPSFFLYAFISLAQYRGSSSLLAVR